MELHSSAGPLDMDLGADHGPASDVDFPAGGPKGGGEGGGLDFEFTERSSDALAPTVETPRIKATAVGAEEPTQEVAIEDLGLDVGSFRSVGDGDDREDTLAIRRESVVEDTVESPRIQKQAPDSDEDDDLLSATGIMKDQTGILRSLDTTGEIPTIEYGDPTGELPTIQSPRLGSGSVTEVDFQLGDEPLTMSEVGTKLDLARAYIDMGDPEGARSILGEVLKEGTAEQKQEAERLMASLP
jgi:pilus assembly protein FimV